MVARLNRPTGLPQITTQRVDQPVIQRAVDAITRTLIAVVNFLQPFAQPQPWVAVPFNSDWTATLSTLQAPQFRKDPLGYVELRGWASTATGVSNVIAVLPVTHRPPTRSSFPAFRLNGATYTVARLDVDVDGRVLMASPAVGAGDSVTLSGIKFSVDP